jgi:hypothetical protein
MEYFTLNEQGQPLPEADFDTWTRWFETADRSVARTSVAPTVIVLTTFSGMDEMDQGELPMLFHTRVFGGVLDAEELVHPTRQEALAAHASLAEWCRVGNSPDAGISEEDLA